MRFIMLRIRARWFQRRASYLKSIGDCEGAASAEARSELLFRELRAREVQS